MSRIVRFSSAITCAVLFAATANAQIVGMAGEYAEGNGIIVNIPQNPPQVACIAAEARCVGKRDLAPGDLITTATTGGGTSMVPPALTGTPNAIPFLRNGPSFGVYGAQNISAPGATAVGGQFTVPTLAFQQRLGKQVGQVLNNIVVQLDTTFTAAMPGSERGVNDGTPANFYTVTGAGGRGVFLSTNPAYVANPDTRVMAARGFSVTNVNAHGQNNGLSTADPNYEYRQAVNTVRTDTYAADDLRISYANSNPTGFGGTMTILLDGTGRLYLASPGLDANFDPLGTNFLPPIVGTNPVGDTIAGFNDRNAAGWAYTVVGRQLPGRFKAFGFAASAVVGPGAANTGIQGVPCGATAFNTTCNLIQGNFDTEGFTVAPLAGADSTKFMFAWTTGTVSIVRTGPRQGVVRTLTQTGMGYDSITTGGDRNVGLVAGSYTKRIDGNGIENMNTQMAGIDLKFTPEPGATVALISGIGLLGALAARRRS